MSKAFTKDDGPAEAPILRRRAPLPAGVPNYVTPRGLRALRDELVALDAGARVRVASAGGDVRDIRIVGVDEADPAANAIAFVAPLARALLGRRAGDVVSVQTPGGEEELTVVAVTYDGE